MLKTLNRAWHLGRSILDRARPHYMILYVTARCNLRCPHCFYLEEIDSAVKERELTVAEFDQIAASLPTLVQLTCTGGEPFVREDIDEVAAVFYRRSHTRFFTLTTNGTMPVLVAGKVERICRECPQAVVRIPLSIDGVGEVHDRIRGKAGTFDNVMETYRRLLDLSRRVDNLRIDVTSVLSKLSEDHIFALIDFVRSHMEIENHTILYARGAIREPEKIVAETERYRQVVTELGRRPRTYRFPVVSRAFVRLREAVESVIVEIQSTREMPFLCKAGESFIELNEYGRLFPCEILQTLLDERHTKPTDIRDVWMGDVREFGYDVPKALRSPKARALRRFIQDKGCACTFECALGASLAFHPENWGRLLTRKVAGHPPGHA